MLPERACGERLAACTEIFRLGVVLYDLLTDVLRRRLAYTSRPHSRSPDREEKSPWMREFNGSQVLERSDTHRLKREPNRETAKHPLLTSGLTRHCFIPTVRLLAFLSCSDKPDAGERSSEQAIASCF